MVAHHSRSNYSKGFASSGQLCVVSGVAQSCVVHSSIKCAQQGCSLVPRLSPQKAGGGESLVTSVLARPLPKGTVPFGGSNVPFGSAPKPVMCPLG